MKPDRSTSSEHAEESSSRQRGTEWVMNDVEETNSNELEAGKQREAYLDSGTHGEEERHILNPHLLRETGGIS